LATVEDLFSRRMVRFAISDAYKTAEADAAATSPSIRASSRDAVARRVDDLRRLRAIIARSSQFLGQVDRP
jgi:hypothetical protein